MFSFPIINRNPSLIRWGSFCDHCQKVFSGEEYSWHSDRINNIDFCSYECYQIYQDSSPAERLLSKRYPKFKPKKPDGLFSNLFLSAQWFPRDLITEINISYYDVFGDVEFSEFPNLISLNLRNNNFVFVDLSKNEKITTFVCSNNNLEDVKFADCNKISFLNISNNPFLNNSRFLAYLQIHQLEYLNLENSPIEEQLKAFIRSKEKFALGDSKYNKSGIGILIVNYIILLKRWKDDQRKKEQFWNSFELTNNYSFTSSSSLANCSREQIIDFLRSHLKSNGKNALNKFLLAQKNLENKRLELSNFVSHKELEILEQKIENNHFQY